MNPAIYNEFDKSVLELTKNINNLSNAIQEYRQGVFNPIVTLEVKPFNRKNYKEIDSILIENYYYSVFYNLLINKETKRPTGEIEIIAILRCHIKDEDEYKPLRLLQKSIYDEIYNNIEEMEFEFIDQ